MNKKFFKAFLCIVLALLITSSVWTIVFAEYINYSETNYTLEEINSNDRLLAVGKTRPEYVVAEFNDEKTEVIITKNGKNSDGIIDEYYRLSYKDLISVNIGNDVKGFSGRTFEFSESLSNITVSSENEDYLTAGGVLFTKDMNTLVIYPVNKSDAVYTVPDGVKVIGNDAFSFCNKLEKVTLTDSIVEIGQSAFSNCLALTTVDMPKNLKIISYCAFAHCESLVDIVIPESVTTIDWQAFLACTSLKEINIPKNVTSKYDRTFLMCESLESINVSSENTIFASIDGVLLNKDMTELIQYPCGKKDIKYTIPDGVKYITSSAFSHANYIEEVLFPDTMIAIDSMAFRYCDSIKSVKLPNSVTALGYESFYECISLENVVLSESMTRVENDTFNGCKNLKSITLPNGVIYIGANAFNGCSSLESVDIPDELRVMDYGAFMGCESLENIYLPQFLHSVSNGSPFSKCLSLERVDVHPENETFTSVDGILFTKNMKQIIRYPAGKTEKEYVIPNSVVTIGDYAFDYDSSLENVSISESVTKIGECAFYNSHSLEAITISKYISKIGPMAFTCSKALTDINVDEDNTSYISVDGILYNKNLDKLICYPGGRTDEFYEISEHVTTIGAMAFYGCTNLEYVIVPKTVTRIEYLGLDDQYGYPITIHGFAGTIAEQYAKENGNKFVDISNQNLIGDVNGDGGISSVDARWILQAVANLRTFTEEELAVSDVNGDGKLNAVDARWVLQMVAGLR